MSTRKEYSKEFKEEAVKLLRSSGKKSLEIATDLGITRNNLLRWKRELEDRERENISVIINP